MPWFRRTRNIYRRLRKKPIGYVHLELKKGIPHFLEPRSFVEKRIMPDPPFTFYKLWEDSKQLIASDRVKGLIVHLRSSPGNLSDYQSLRDLLAYWKTNGKSVWIYSNSYDMSSYYLATVADKIFVTQGGSLNTIGINMMTSFLRDYLKDKGINAQVIQVSPYKAAFNSFVYKELPEEQRENLQWMVDSFYNTMVSAIAEGREQEKQVVEKMIDNSPLIDNLALDQGWIDGILSPHGIREILEKELNRARLTDWEDAMGRLVMRKNGKPNIGIIPVEGTIIDGESRSRELPVPIPIFADKQAGDLSVVQAIRKVRREKNFKAAILYVDSGGGSATSSEAMLAELGRLAKEKPVYAYFNNVAASGGYYVAMNCEKIYAQDLTITGSIGVINAKISTKEAYEQRDINRYRINRGKNSNIFGSYELWDEEQIELNRQMIFRVYDIFKSHVAKNREMDLEDVDTLAGGRVWTGAQAKEHGLLDELGNINQVLQDLVEVTGLKRAIPTVIVDEKKSLVPETPPMDVNQLLREIRVFNGKPLLMMPYILEIN